MEYRDINNSKKLSRLGMGNMRLPIIPGGKDSDIDYLKASEIIDYAINNGVTYFDTAPVYHNQCSEEFLGKALSKYDRESYTIATKFSRWLNKNYEELFESQLKKLNTPYIDFYLLHAVDDRSYQKYLDSGCIEYFEKQRELGRIKKLGFSFHGSPETLEIMTEAHKWDFVQIQLNYYDWMYSTSKKEYEILFGKNIPVVVMESVRGGRLAKLNPEAEEMLHTAHPDWSTASWAFRWLKSLPGMYISLSGMTTLDQIKDNVNTFSDEYVFTKEDESTLFKACESFRKTVHVPCTGCRYCTEKCPAEINIPEVLKVYNDYKLNGSWHLNKLKEIESKGMPSDCISCGQCLSHCPQEIDTPAIMAELVEALK